MRISAKERADFVAVLQPVVPLESELILYGSRVDDQALGGDIDLVLVVSDTQAKEHLEKQRLALLVKWKARIGDQRIDFSVITRDQAQNEPFWRQSLQKAVVLARF